MISEFDSQVADLHSLVTSLQRWLLMSYICFASDMSDHCHAQRGATIQAKSSKSSHRSAITSYHKSQAPVGSTNAAQEMQNSETHRLQFRVVDSRAWIQVLVYRPILAVVRHKESQVHDLRQHRQRPQGRYFRWYFVTGACSVLWPRTSLTNQWWWNHKGKEKHGFIRHRITYS